VTGRLHVVLLAGGTGTRFWPLSRASRPKQMLRLFGTRSLLQATWDRARLLVPVSRVWLVAPRDLAGAIRRQLPALRADRVVLEPSARGTAAAVGLACRAVEAAEPSAVVAILPTDHVVRDPEAFVGTVRRAARASVPDVLVGLGVKPDHPATGFGYLEIGAPAHGARAARVRRFVEKPKPSAARRFVRSRRHLWNAGVVVGRASTILDELRRHAPRIHRGVTADRAAAWKAMPRASFDRAVLERTDRLAVVPLDAGWADVGSWDAAAAHAVSRGAGPAPIALASPGSAVFGDGRVVVLVGVPDVVVVDTPDAVLVVARSAAERVREIVAKVARVRPEVVR